MFKKFATPMKKTSIYFYRLKISFTEKKVGKVLYSFDKKVKVKKNVNYILYKKMRKYFIYCNGKIEHIIFFYALEIKK